MVYRFVEKSEKVGEVLDCNFETAITRRPLPGAGALLIPLFQHGVSMGAWWGANMNAHAQATASAIDILSLSGTTRMSVHPHV